MPLRSRTVAPGRCVWPRRWASACGGLTRTKWCVAARTVANGPAIASVATGAGSKGAGKGAAGAAGAVAVVDPLVLESGFMVFKDYVVDIYLGTRPRYPATRG